MRETDSPRTPHLKALSRVVSEALIAKTPRLPSKSTNLHLHSRRKEDHEHGGVLHRLQSLAAGVSLETPQPEALKP